MTVPKHLKEYLSKHTNILEVHFNSKGEYLFQHRKTHLLPMTREQVLNSPTIEDEAIVEAAVMAEVQTKKNGVQQVEIKKVRTTKK